LWPGLLTLDPRELGVEQASEDELYQVMDWLGQRQERIEGKLAKKHLDNGSFVLYDVTSTYFEGRTCPPARLGHNRDGKKGKLQIGFGLLCSHEGCPVAVEVFPGDTGDPSTLEEQIRKIRDRFGLGRVILVGDRGLITEARIREEIRPVKGLEWITALRSSQIRKLVDSGSLQLSLFDEQDLAEITDPAYPKERLVVCRNPMLAYYVEWHMRQLLAPILFDEDVPQGAQASRKSVVAPAQRSDSAKAKARRKRTKDNLPVHSFRTLLKDLATICKSRVQPHFPAAPAFDKITLPTPVQHRASNFCV